MIGRMFAAITAGWVATCAPSMEKTTDEPVQSIRYRCGVPMQSPGTSVSVADVPSWVRA